MAIVIVAYVSLLLDEEWPPVGAVAFFVLLVGAPLLGYFLSRRSRCTV